MHIFQFNNLLFFLFSRICIQQKFLDTSFYTHSKIIFTDKDLFAAETACVSGHFLILSKRKNLLSLFLVFLTLTRKMSNTQQSRWFSNLISVLVYIRKNYFSIWPYPQFLICTNLFCTKLIFRRNSIYHKYVHFYHPGNLLSHCLSLKFSQFSEKIQWIHHRMFHQKTTMIYHLLSLWLRTNFDYFLLYFCFPILFYIHHFHQ